MRALGKIIALIVIVGILFTIIGYGQTTAKQKPVRQQWEYIVEHFDREEYIFGNMQKRLNKLGNDGWEYAGPLVNDGLNGHIVLFKRLK